MDNEYDDIADQIMRYKMSNNEHN